MSALATFLCGCLILLSLQGAPCADQLSPVGAPPAFVGARVCAECHQDELNRWMGSHHQLAMQPATARTVRGNFNNAKFSNAGAASTFFRRDGKFMVRTEGPDGTLHDYEIEFTFGVYPLQQYLIAMPGGRLQALGIAWDSRAREAGGQRWFTLHPNRKIPAGNPLHWTGIDQTWNYMCADCHSTNLRKNYDLPTRSYATTYAEIDVACEACHGPGSNHVAWAKKEGDWREHEPTEGLTIALDERKGAAWTIDPATGNPHRIPPRISEREIQLCARCHSRRGQIHEDYVHGQPVDDDYRVALLDGDLYFPDGQIKGEVYEYGSFIQSRMYHDGVTCSDCHDPHSLKLRAAGNNVCLQCHTAQRFDSPRHHFHRSSSAGAQCVACHMPKRTYMVVHERHDHSFRVPRPDLTLRLGAPNACNQCHRDKSAEWASAAIQRWYGQQPNGFQRYAEALHAGAEGSPGAPTLLTQLVTNREQPAIARATALSLLSAYRPRPDDTSVRAGVADFSPLVRRAAIQAVSAVDGSASIPTLRPLLNDSARAVRAESAAALAAVPPDRLGNLGSAYGHALQDYVDAQLLNADRPEAHVDLAILYAEQNHLPEAERELKTALSLDPTFAPAAVNLADLYRAQNRDADGERVLRTAIGSSPDDASLRHALGLVMVREKRKAEARDQLAAAARMAPDNVRFAYVYAIALHDAGQNSAAIETLERALKSHPYDRESLVALTTYLGAAGESAMAREYSDRLEELDRGTVIPPTGGEQH